MALSKNRLSEVIVDDSIVLSPSPEAKQDRQMAIHDLLEGNSFSLSNGLEGPYVLRLSSIDSRLIFDLSSATGKFAIGLSLSISPDCERLFSNLRQL
jgi:uncharacterized protein (UPF0262 family)